MEMSVRMYIKSLYVGNRGDNSSDKKETVSHDLKEEI
jgi:hypothetical protein